MENSTERTETVDEKSANQSGWQTHLDFTEGLFTTNRVLNLVGLLGSAMTVWQFVDTLFRLRNGEIGIGLYLNSFVVVFFFILFMWIASYKVSKENSFYTFMSSCYALIFAFILIATYFISCSVVLREPSIYDSVLATDWKLEYSRNNLFDNFIYQVTNSASILALFLFSAAYFSFKFFIKDSSPRVSGISAIPLTLLFLWLCYFLVSRGQILSEFHAGFNFENLAGYFLATVMTVMLFLLAKSTLKSDKSSDL